MIKLRRTKIPRANTPYTHIDLFSGIGGFALAAKWAGIKTIQFVEIDPFCQKVLQKNFPGVPIHDDIKTFKNNKLKNIGIITGGYPCQPFSFAGNRKGKEDDRHLWPKMFEIIQAKRPNWIICENVYGHISMGLDKVLTDLENEAYSCQTFIVPACAINAPHRRDRVWIVAYDTRGEESRGLSGIQRETIPTIREADSYAPNTTGSSNRPERWIYEGSQYSKPSRIPMWNEPWLEIATRLCRVDDGVPGRVDRLGSLGNAIVPQIAYEIMKAIIQIEKMETPTRY